MANHLYAAQYRSSKGVSVRGTGTRCDSSVGLKELNRSLLLSAYGSTRMATRSGMGTVLCRMSRVNFSFDFGIDDENDKFLRTGAFLLWAATRQDDDLKVLRTASVPQQLAERVLAQRLARGDQQAIPAMIEKLK